MVEVDKEAIVNVTLQEYKYSKFGVEATVFAIVASPFGNMAHPDPLKKMLWGRTAGCVISDFKRFFVKVGNPFNVRIAVPAQHATAAQVKAKMLEDVDKIIKAIILNRLANANVVEGA